MSRVVALVLGLAPFAAPAVAHACPWDSDTEMLQDAPLPAVLDLIAGRFARHSDAFYRWRAASSRAALLEDPEDLARMDDLAVALDRLGRSDEAIAVMEDALLSDPERYETHANLGTFHQHRGALGLARHHIQRALDSGPRRHGDCEALQLALLEYAELRDPIGPGHDEATLAADEALGFAARADVAPDVALHGLARMMLRGEHQWPALLEAVGDLQPVGGHKLEPVRVRATAYVRAADVETRARAAQAYRDAATHTLARIGVEDLAAIEYALHWEVADTTAWNAQIGDQESAWLADETVDPQAAFAAAYYVGPAPESAAEASPAEPKPDASWMWLLWLPLGGAVLTIALGRAHAMS